MTHDVDAPPDHCHFTGWARWPGLGWTPTYSAATEDEVWHAMATGSAVLFTVERVVLPSTERPDGRRRRWRRPRA